MIHELGRLFDRDILKLLKEIELFGNEDDLWKTLDGVTNSAGNLSLHLCGNLQTYIGKNIGSIPYVRDRDAEFSTRGMSKHELLSGILTMQQVVSGTFERMTNATLDERHPENVLGTEMTNGFFLMHLLAHLSYHLGQINYIRRILEPTAR